MTLSIFDVYVVNMTKHNIHLMRAGAVQHPRVCRLFQELQTNLFTASIFQTTDGFLHFYVEKFMVFLLYLNGNYRNRNKNRT